MYHEHSSRYPITIPTIHASLLQGVSTNLKPNNTPTAEPNDTNEPTREILHRLRNKGIRLVTEFSSMEAPNYALKGLVGDFIHASASDSSAASSNSSQETIAVSPPLTLFTKGISAKSTARTCLSQALLANHGHQLETALATTTQERASTTPPSNELSPLSLKYSPLKIHPTSRPMIKEKLRKTSSPN